MMMAGEGLDETSMSLKRKHKDLFWNTFMGEYVEILCRTENPDKMPLVVQGYLLDRDDDYYYMGEGILEVDAAIKKNDVVIISNRKEKDATLEVLENMPLPFKPEGHN